MNQINLIEAAKQTLEPLKEEYFFTGVDFTFETWWVYLAMRAVKDSI